MNARTYIFSREINDFSNNQSNVKSTLVLFRRKLRQDVHPKLGYVHFFRAEIPVQRIQGCNGPYAQPIACIVGSFDVQPLNVQAGIVKTKTGDFLLVVEGVRDEMADAIVFSGPATISISLALPDGFNWIEGHATWQKIPGQPTEDEKIFPRYITTKHINDLRQSLSTQTDVDEYREYVDQAGLGPCQYQSLPKP